MPVESAPDTPLARLPWKRPFAILTRDEAGLEN